MSSKHKLGQHVEYQPALSTADAYAEGVAWGAVSSLPRQEPGLAPQKQTLRQGFECK